MPRKKAEKNIEQQEQKPTEIAPVTAEVLSVQQIPKKKKTTAKKTAKGKL